MSNPPRLLLLSGSGGAGTSTLAVRIAELCAKSGKRTHLIDLSDLRDRQAARDAAASWLGTLVAEALLGSVADPLLAEELTTLPGIDDFLALAAIADAADDDSLDVLIVDSGPLTAFEELLMLPAALDLLARSLMTPEHAIAGGTGMLAELRAELARIEAVLARESTTARLVIDADADAIARTRRTLTVAALHEVTVDLVYAAKVPRKGDAWPKEWARTRRLRARELGAALPVEVERLPMLADDPGGGLDRSLADLSVHRRLPLPEVLAADGRFRWRIPAEGCEASAVRIGRADDRAVIDIGGVRRVRDLPSVIRRCRIERVLIDGSMLEFDCVPDEAAWMRDG